MRVICQKHNIEYETEVVNHLGWKLNAICPKCADEIREREDEEERKRAREQKIAALQELLS